MEKSMKSSAAKIGSATFGFLAIVFIIMQFTEEVNWQIGDFIIAAFLITTILSALELIRIKVKSKNKRIALIIFAIISFLLIWIELAVGIFEF